MINVNDPKEWSKIDWSDPVPLKIRSDATVNRGRSALGKKNNPEYSATMRKVASQRGEEHNQAVRRGCNEKRDNTYQAECNARPEVQAKISASITQHIRTAEHNARNAEANARNAQDPAWHAALMDGLARRDRPFHTPYGVFPSLNAAARYVTEQGLLTNAVKKFEKWKKTDPTNYYFEEK